MSGIAVVYDDDPALIKKVLKRMEHRGKEVRSIMQTPGAVLGYTSNTEKPKNDNLDRTAICDGRIIYNVSGDMEPPLKEGINKNKDLFKLYNKHGKDCVHFLNGPFALAIANGVELFVARDPLGLKPLYYSKINDNYVFASEIKGLAPYTKEIKPFPPGYYYHSSEGFNKYYPGPEYRDILTSKE